MSWLIYQWQLLCLSISFFSRLPIPASTPFSNERLAKSNRYFGVVGLILGGITASSYGVVSAIAPDTVAVIIAMIVSVVLTGAFHEDGLADTADGLGGGLSVDKKLEIMKDSRIGTYGAVTLISALGLKFFLLLEIASITNLGVTIVFSYIASRTLAATLIFNTPYVSSSDTSKSKPLASSQSKGELLFLVASCLCLLFIAMDSNAVLLLILIAIALRSIIRRYFVKSIGGITGDCLGAVQQVSELVFYFFVLVITGNGFVLYTL